VEVREPAVEGTVRILLTDRPLKFRTVHVLPPSAERSIPHPSNPTPLPELPVAAYTMLGFTGSNVTAEIASEHCWSVSGVHVAPPSAVLESPPVSELT
jgi:hypothetical protein